MLGSLSLAAHVGVEAGEGNDVLVSDDVVQVPATWVSTTCCQAGKSRARAGGVVRKGKRTSLRRRSACL